MIFSVVIGLATGNQSFLVASVGTFVIAATMLILLAFKSVGSGSTHAQLRLVIDSIDASHEGWESVLREHAVGFKIKTCTVDRSASTQSLSLEVTGVNEDQWPKVLNALMALPSIKRASGRPIED